MAATVQINQTVFRAELLKGFNSPSIIDQAYVIANEGFTDERDEFINDIKNDEITVALQEESSDPTKSDSIVRSVNGDGNLYSFLGFNYGDGDPTREPIEVLEELKLKKTSLGAQYKRDKITYEFPISYPSLQEIYNAAPPLEWDDKSWLDRVERGVNNVTRYLFGDFKSNKSRSTAGIQLKKDVKNSNGAYYRPPKDGYIISKYKKFLDKFRNIG